MKEAEHDKDAPLFQSAGFFEKAAEELKEICMQGKFEKETQKRLKNIKRLQCEKEKRQKPEKSLLNNLIIDYLRSNSLNYAYSVFMRECDFLSADVVGKLMLSKLLNIEQ